MVGGIGDFLFLLHFNLFLNYFIGIRIEKMNQTGKEKYG